VLAELFNIPKRFDPPESGAITGIAWAYCDIHLSLHIHSGPHIALAVCSESDFLRDGQLFTPETLQTALASVGVLRASLAVGASR
jgi:hypothetical protein